MKKIYLNQTILFVVSSLSTLALFNSCSTNPLLSENIKLNLPEQRKMEKEADNPASQVYASSNLRDFTFPTEDELYTEANFKNKDLYYQNVRILIDWVDKNLSLKQKDQLSKNCEILVGNFDNRFPLDEKTIACAAWWVEYKNSQFVQQQKLNNLDNLLPSVVYLSNTEKRDWNNFRNLTFSQVFPLIEFDTLDKAKFYAKKALKNAPDCSLQNANISVMLRLENFLPNSKILNYIENIYSGMEQCLLPKQEMSEKIHLRMGLIRLVQGNPEASFASLKKTQLENNPQENSRSLFWLGTIYQKTNRDQKVNPYWQQLIKETPLSLAAIVANQQMGMDPMSVLVADEKIPIANRVGSGWSKENLEAFIFDLILSKKKKDASFAWANYVTKNMTTINPALILYWAYVQNNYHNYYKSIVLLSRYSRYQQNLQISRAFLNLQFPRAYLQEILGAKGGVDPIFVLSLMRQESAFDANARSTANARGLMQLLPSTAKSLKRSILPNDLYDADLNIEVGVHYLERLFKKYDGKSEYVLAAYNAGALNLDKWLNRVPQENTMLFCDLIPFKETRSYVSIILRNYYWYARIFAENNSDNISQKMLIRSMKSQWKSERIQALLASSTPSFVMTETQKKLLDRIYVFGSDNKLSALSSNQK